MIWYKSETPLVFTKSTTVLKDTRCRRQTVGYPLDREFYGESSRSFTFKLSCEYYTAIEVHEDTLTI